MGIINVIVAAQKLLQFSQTTNKSSFTVMRKTLNAALQNVFVRYLQFSIFNFVRIIQMTSYLQFCIFADILKVGNTGAVCHMQDILEFRK